MTFHSTWVLQQQLFWCYKREESPGGPASPININLFAVRSISPSLLGLFQLTAFKLLYVHLDISISFINKNIAFKTIYFYNIP